MGQMIISPPRVFASFGRWIPDPRSAYFCMAGIKLNGSPNIIKQLGLKIYLNLMLVQASSSNNRILQYCRNCIFNKRKFKPPMALSLQSATKKITFFFVGKVPGASDQSWGDWPPPCIRKSKKTCCVCNICIKSQSDIRTYLKQIRGKIHLEGWRFIRITNYCGHIARCMSTTITVGNL